MASVSLAPAEAAIEQPHLAAPAWWRHAHSYSVPVVVAGQIAATWLVIKLAERSTLLSPLLLEVGVAGETGFMFAQCFLLGMWAALGGLATIPRWLIVAAVTVAGAMTVAGSLIEPGWENFINAAPEIIMVTGALMAGFAAVLLPLRRLAGWRIDFDAVYYQPTARRRGQLAMMDFAAMFCAVALPLTLCRVLMESDESQGTDAPLFLGIFGLVVMATAAPVARAVLARHYVLWLGGAALWVLAMSWGQSLLMTFVPDLDLFDTQVSTAGLHWEVLAFHVGIAIAVAAPLLFLRCCGLKLLVVHAGKSIKA